MAAKVIDAVVLTNDQRQLGLSTIIPSTFGGSYYSFPHYFSYNWKLSTEDNYRSRDYTFCEKFKSIRRRLDYDFHAYYSVARQLQQDQIIESLLPSNDNSMKDNDGPWIIFTAGVMGAGKTHTVRRLSAAGQFSLESFVSVDPDEVRRLLPEFSIYVENEPDKAGERTRKEAGMISEILTEAALERGQNVLVDGSLRDSDWYVKYFEKLRQDHPKLKLGIIHVTAPMEDIFERVERRAKDTGRVVPLDVLMQCLEQVPKSVDILRQHVDFFVEIHNAGDGNFTLSSVEDSVQKLTP